MTGWALAVLLSAASLLPPTTVRAQSAAATAATAAPTIKVVKDSRLAGRVELRIVAHTDGIDLAHATTNAALAEALGALAARGVRIEACNNTMTGRGVTREALMPFVTVTESAVGEIALLQHQGYVYFRP